MPSFCFSFLSLLHCLSASAFNSILFHLLEGLVLSIIQHFPFFLLFTSVLRATPLLKKNSFKLVTSPQLSPSITA